MIIAVDFDGTIVRHEFPRLGDPVPGAIQWLKRFQMIGADLILHTLRADDMPDCPGGLTEAVEYLSENGITLYGANQNPRQSRWSSSRKTYAHVYIDDSALGCPLVFPRKGRPYVDWEAVGPMVEQLIIENY